VAGGSGSGSAAAAAAAGAPDALTRLQRASAGREHDLARVLPRLAAAAQRVHMQLLALLSRCSFSPDELRGQLLVPLGVAEARWRESVAGTPLEAALIAAARELEAARGAQPGQQPQQVEEAVGGGEGGDDGGVAAAAEGEEGGDSGGGGGGGGGGALPRCLDFAWQRTQVEALAAALAPLMDRAGQVEQREGARLAVRLQHEVGGWVGQALMLAPSARDRPPARLILCDACCSWGG
jgi:hypothetical protein